MALSLSELVAAARQKDDQIGVTDRWQKGWNDLSGGLGDVFGTIYGGKLVGGLSGNQGNEQNAQSLGAILSQIYGG